MTDNPEVTEIEMSVWVHRGGLCIRRECLPLSDPDYPYNYIKRTYNVAPESFGYFMDKAELVEEAKRQAMVERYRYDGSEKYLG